MNIWCPSIIVGGSKEERMENFEIGCWVSQHVELSTYDKCEETCLVTFRSILFIYLFLLEV